jgi:hypothetical protein
LEGNEVGERLKGYLHTIFREESVAIWSAFSFDVEKKIAGAWVPESFIEVFTQKGWICGIFRSDILQPASTLLQKNSELTDFSQIL